MTSKMILQKVILVQRYHGTNPADTTRPFGGPGFGYDYDPTGDCLSDRRSNEGREGWVYKSFLSLS